MIQIYTSDSEAGYLQACAEMEKGSWISVTEPTPEDLHELAIKLGLDYQFLQDLNDGEEKARLEYEDDYTLIIIDAPIVELQSDNPVFYTAPLVMLIVRDVILTMCIKNTSILEEFRLYKQKRFRTDKPITFVLQLLLKTSSYYIKFLKHIDRRTNEIEDAVRRSTSNLKTSGVHSACSVTQKTSARASLPSSPNVTRSSRASRCTRSAPVPFTKRLEMPGCRSRVTTPPVA